LCASGHHTLSVLQYLVVLDWELLVLVLVFVVWVLDTSLDRTISRYSDRSYVPVTVNEFSIHIDHGAFLMWRPFWVQKIGQGHRATKWMVEGCALCLPV